jgi:L-seryl-tRNA(Ser) seleniumtransferase
VRVDDYTRAVDESVAFVLKVHPSNFRVEGFTASVPVAELTGLGVPLVVDIGSGLLTRHPRLPDEPDATSALEAGADLVTASGDKLLGGPQCGLLLGRADLVESLRRHAFARAVRVDKLTLAALEATLTGPATPVAAALATHRDELLSRARRMAMEIGPGDAAAVASEGRVGGGGAPGVPLASAALALDRRWAGPLRGAEPPVIGHVHDGRLLLDLLTVAPDDDATLVEAVRRVLADERAG